MLLAAVFYNRHLNEEARRQSNFTAEAISEMVALTLQFEDSNRYGPRLRELLDEIAREVPFPLIITDTEGRPLFWQVRDISLDDSYDFEVLQNIDLQNPPTPELARLIEMAGKFRAEHREKVFYYPGIPARVQGYVCFGRSYLARGLTLATMVQLGMIALFAIVGVIGFFFFKRLEQESIWVGLARETAHQMGTPLTSLMGWVQLSQSRLADGIADDDREEALEQMESDIERLRKVSDRFNNIGGTPALKRGDVRPVIEQVVAYFRRRLPHLKAQVEIREQYDEVPLVRHHEQLLEWVIENLIKNALDAIDKEQGVITITLSYNSTEEAVDCHIRDNGRGMSPAVRRKVFHPGYSSKQGGWGLGLVLSKRIVEEYHGGRLFLLDAHEGHGSCFVARFPA